MSSILDVGKSQGFWHHELSALFRIQMVFESWNASWGFQPGCQNRPENKESQNTVVSEAYLKELSLPKTWDMPTISQPGV